MHYPLPPHVTVKQAQALASTLTKGDPREWRVIKETAKELVADLLLNLAEVDQRHALPGWSGFFRA